MANVGRRHAEAREEFGLERQNDGEAVHIGAEPGSALRPPSPELGRDVVENGNPGCTRGTGNPQMQPGVIHQNGEVVAARDEIVSQRLEEPVVQWKRSQYRAEPHPAEPLHRESWFGAGSFEPWAPHCLEHRIGQQLLDRLDDTGSMKIAGRLAGRNENPGSATGHGKARVRALRATAAETSSARTRAALPSSPRTTASLSPRTAWTKLKSSRFRASARGASSGIRSISARSSGSPSVQPSRSRRNSPRPAPRSRERHPSAW